MASYYDPPIVDSKVFNGVAPNTIPSGTVDCTVDSKGNIVITGLATKIPLKDPSAAYTKIAYTAGVAAVRKITFTAVPANTSIRIRIRKFVPADAGKAILPLSIYAGEKAYNFDQGTVADDGTLLALQIKAALDADYAAGLQPFATVAVTAGAVTVTAPNALFDFAILCDTVATGLTFTYPAGTANTPPSGTYAQVVAVNAAAISGDTYDTHIFTFTKESTSTDFATQSPHRTKVQCRVFIKPGITNEANLTLAITACVGGHFTPLAFYDAIS